MENAHPREVGVIQLNQVIRILLARQELQEDAFVVWVFLEAKREGIHQFDYL